MDLVRVLRAYVLDAVSGGGYKALILDKDTMRVCSTMFGRSELADMNVVHIERLDGLDPKENHPELKAVAFIRPTRDNVTLLKRELKAPRFQSLSLSFTNLVNPIHLQELAEVDAVKEFISEVQELFGDFCVIDSHHFMIPCHRNDILLAPSTAASSTAIIQAEMLDRMVQGLSALFLAVRRRPIIRYQRNSEQASRLADSLYNLTYKQQYQLFDFGARGTPVLLILDRRDDPVTPLLTQWSYQAMIHELIGINDNTVKLTSPKVPEEDREVVLDPRSDDFLLKHAALNFGEVGLSVKALMEHYQTAESKHKQVETLDDMRRFMMEHLDFKRMQGNVIKHVNLMSQLSDTVSKRRLLEVSELEQELANPATGTSASSCAEECARIIRQPDITDFDKVRLAMLFALRYEPDGLRIRQLLEELAAAGVRDREAKLYGAVEAVLKCAGANSRAGDLYASRSIMNKAKTMLRGLQGVDNVYTQHTPLVTATLTNLLTDKLDSAAYPYMTATQDEAFSHQMTLRRTPPRELIVFIVGGTTYEEAKAIADWNERNPHMRVLLGGTAVLNASAFVGALAGGGTEAGPVVISVH